MKLSVIVPVYNMAGDGKLNFCLDSLVNQDFDGDYEIICVDDCSTDDSMSILREYESRYPDLFVVRKNDRNRHQGGARNEGIRLARGEWISFIDSDDWVAKNYYSRLIGLGEEKNADVVGCCYSMVNEHTFEIGKISRDDLDGACGDMTPDRRKAFLANMSSMVTKVYRASLIRDNDLTFPEDIFYEDNAAGPVWAMHYRHFEYIAEPLYYYYQHDNSTVHTITESRCRDRMTAGEFMLSEMKRRGFIEEYHDEIESHFTTVYFVNTLFSYMRMKKGRKLPVVSELKRRMLEEFPDFRKNRNYGRYMDDEQKAYVDLLMKNTFIFYVKYILLWMYRDLKAR